uniref:Uncharacterized protein n=1 Tax=Lygus hesperus TaxID=30085 RepID=A0A146MFJ3_LYGHE
MTPKRASGEKELLTHEKMKRKVGTASTAAKTKRKTIRKKRKRMTKKVRAEGSSSGALGSMNEIPVERLERIPEDILKNCDTDSTSRRDARVKLNMFEEFNESEIDSLHETLLNKLEVMRQAKHLVLDLAPSLINRPLKSSTDINRHNTWLAHQIRKLAFSLTHTPNA